MILTIRGLTERFVASVADVQCQPAHRNDSNRCITVAQAANGDARRDQLRVGRMRTMSPSHFTWLALRAAERKSGDELTVGCSCHRELQCWLPFPLGILNWINFCDQFNLNGANFFRKGKTVDGIGVDRPGAGIGVAFERTPALERAVDSLARPAADGDRGLRGAQPCMELV